MRTTKLLWTVVSVLSLSACTQTPTTVQNQSSPSSQVSGSAGRLSIEEAKAIAFQAAHVTADEVSHLTVQEGVDNGRAVYEIDFIHNGQEYSYTLSATDGALLEREMEQADAMTATAVTAEQAKLAGLADAGLIETVVTNLTVKQDTEQMKTVYEVDFVHEGKEYSYTIDATTGLVLSKEQDLAGD